jgi:thiamine-phosphate pyrophosphorylase
VARDPDLAEIAAPRLSITLKRLPGPAFQPVRSRRGEALGRRGSDAALVFVSPVFPTRRTPTHRYLGEAGALALALMTRKPAIALGGMTAAEAGDVMQMGWAGWAGIDAWI